VALGEGSPVRKRRQNRWIQARLADDLRRGNIDLIRPIHEAWRRGDWRPSFDVYDPEMEWGWSDEFPGLAGVYRDTRDPNPRIRTWLSGWEDWRVEAEDYVKLGDYVIVLARYRGRGKGSGVEVEQEGAHVFKLKDGKVVRLEIFADRQRAIDEVNSARSAERDAVG
jgi:uncharacterized protein